MEKEWVLKKYAYFYKTLEKIADFKGAEIIVDDLGMPKGKMQTAYNDIKALKFEGRLIDYLCWICTERYLMTLETCRNDTFNDLLKLMTVDYMLRSEPEVINFVRLVVKNPKYMLNSEYFRKIVERYSPKNHADFENTFYIFISMLWFSNFQPSYLHNVTLYSDYIKEIVDRMVTQIETKND